MMSAILYYLFLKPLSLLPLRVLHGISDVLYLVLYRIFGYRKKVVRDNLKRSFPEKTDAELRVIERKFYSHFCDLVVESVKNFSISEADSQARVKAVNAEEIALLAREGKNIIVAGGHYNNWELWGVAAAKHFEHELVGVYKPLTNQFFDQKMRETRGRFGLSLVPMKDSAAYLTREHQRPVALVLAIDQSPSNPHKCYWTDFLGRDTAVLFGTELFAARHALPVIFGRMTKIRRGYYEISYEIITEDGSQLPYGELTQCVTRALEAQIRETPEFWLWTHKRWKHRLPEGRTLNETQPPQ
jgi:Kdo2-lipid IVA lauroyltransferase/acyltransferase